MLKKSALYETTPQGMEVETGLFYNMALSLRSTLAPDRLLAAIKSFEHHMGRDVAHSHNLPRTVDIDILMMAPYPDATDMGKGIYKTVELEIPHPRMTERAFVLVPLSEIAPAVLHPVRLQTIAALLAQLPQPIAGITPVLTVPS